MPFIHQTKPRLQVDPIECGAVCLGIILDYFGRDESNFSLRTSCQVSRHGAQASSIIEGAQHFGMVAHAKKVLAVDLKNINNPVVIFVDQCHFVVLEGYLWGYYFINDPALGRYKLNVRQFHKRFSNVAIFFHTTSDFKKDVAAYQNSGYLMFKFLLICLGSILAISLCLIIAVISSLITRDIAILKIPWFMLGISIVFLCALIGASLAIALALVSKISQKKSDREIDFLEKSLLTMSPRVYHDIPFSSFGKAYKGVIKENLDNHFIIFKQYYGISLITVIAIAIVLIAPIMVFMLMFLAFIFALYAMTTNQTHKFHLSRLDIEKSYALSIDIEAMGQQDFVTDTLINKRLDLLSSSSAGNTEVISFTIFLFMMVSYYNGLHHFMPQYWQAGMMSRAEFIGCIFMGALIFLFLRLLMPEKNKEIFISSFIRELKSQNESTLDISNHLDPHHLILCQDICFTYRGEKDAIFNQLNIAIAPKKIIAVLGQPRSGKSTFLRLLAGHYSPRQGLIYYQKNLRIALIDEQTSVMNASIRDNITLFDDTISDTRVVQALQQACAIDLFYNRPFGLLALVDEKGSNLSVSEVSRLLLAQALAHDANIIILDDFFDDIDDETAKKIIQSCKNDRTIIFTTHNEKLLNLADITITIDKKTAIQEPL